MRKSDRAVAPLPVASGTSLRSGPATKSRGFVRRVLIVTHKSMEMRHNQLLSRCLSIDLEVDPSRAKIFGIAAVRGDERPVLKSMEGISEKFLD